MTVSAPPNPADLSAVVVTDCGSTTTKALLFEKQADGWHATFRGEAPTTVEKPLADVTIGALNAFGELEELSGRQILNRDDTAGSVPFRKRDQAVPGAGVDLYLSTSSAGGGLQMVVAGVVGSMTTESAERAALGAGAIVMDAISLDDGREEHERVRRIRHLRPDIILVAGGVEGGTVNHPLELAELVLQASPRPRFGETLRLPVIYAANSSAREAVAQLLEKSFQFIPVDNLRPTLEEENLTPARDAIHEIFLTHVMSHAPGYAKLLSWSPVPILPTPAGFGEMVQTAARELGKQVLAVDIGGATTDVFSVLHTASDQAAVFNRTVSANLGMSYSVANVLAEAGIAQIKRWLPVSFSDTEIENRLWNKMIRPTTIPETLADLLLEQAVCREALRLALVHHRRLATGLKGVHVRRLIGDILRQSPTNDLFRMMSVDLIIGSGGVLSHAPDRRSAALMLIDAFEPEGVTELAVDSVFMMPHLGVFSTVHPQAALEILLRDCLVPLGTVIAPLFRTATGQPLVECLDQDTSLLTLRAGELRRIELPAGALRTLTLRPLHRSVDLGAGCGVSRTVSVKGGAAGLIFDGRGRPLRPCTDNVSQAEAWHRCFGLQLPGGVG